MEIALEGILHRNLALGIRTITFDIFRHPDHDSGCRNAGAGFLSVFPEQYDHALLIFDYEGCGSEDTNIEALESEIFADLNKKWPGRCEVIVIAPELENWVWSDSPHVSKILGWDGRTPSLGEWLIEQGFKRPGETKPIRPKEALKGALRCVNKSITSSIYKSLAEKVSFNRCQDRSFIKLKFALYNWFADSA